MAKLIIDNGWADLEYIEKYTYGFDQYKELAGGTIGKRLALPNAEIMIHQPAIHGSGIQGQASDIKIISDHMIKSRQRLNHILADNTGKSIEQVAADTERDYYMSAREAVEYGLIDKIIDRR